MERVSKARSWSRNFHWPCWHAKNSFLTLVIVPLTWLLQLISGSKLLQLMFFFASQFWSSTVNINHVISFLQTSDWNTSACGCHASQRWKTIVGIAQLHYYAYVWGQLSISDCRRLASCGAPLWAFLSWLQASVWFSLNSFQLLIREASQYVLALVCYCIHYTHPLHPFHGDVKRKQIMSVKMFLRTS